MRNSSVRAYRFATITLLFAAGTAGAADDSADRAAEAELYADAATRASFAADGAGSGWDKGKFTLTDGGPNVLRVGGYMQLRYNGNFRQDQPDGDDYTGGFQVQRARLKLDGSVWDKALTYNVMTELAGSSGARLMDAEVRYTFDNKVYVRGGQYKPVFNREELVSDTVQLAVERSVTNTVFSMTRSQGVGIGWQSEQVRLGSDITDGSNNLNTPYDSPKQADFAINARAEWMFVGTDFKRFNDFTSWRESEFTGMLGGAVDYETYDAGNGGSASGYDLLKATADLSLEGNGWNAFAAFFWQQSDPNGGDSTSDMGVVAQGGVFVTDQMELFARYDAVFPDEETGPDNFNTVTAGINYYVSPRSHVFKISGDVIYYIDAVSDCAIIRAPNTTLNLLPDTEGGQVAFMLQAQIIF